MGIIAIDIETRGLDATQFLMGCLIRDKKKGKPVVFRNKDDLWKRVLELGFIEAKQGKVLTIYSHNAQFDTAGYVNLDDKHLIFYSNQPFIWAYRYTIEECKKDKIKFSKKEEIIGFKEIIKFYDSMSIFKSSLKEVGETIGLNKIDTPNELKSDKKEYFTESKLREMEIYMIRDTEIVLKAINYVKDMLKKEGVGIKRLITINQIAIQYFVNKLKLMNDDKVNHLFYNKKLGIMRRTFRAEEIHSSLRGGRTECFKLGEVSSCSYVDCNSEYGKMLSDMSIPDLRSERKVWRPLEEYKKSSREWIEMNSLGISRCLVKNVCDDLGCLSVRTNAQNYFPKSGVQMIGTWTHVELLTALNNGYEIIDIEWTVRWNEGFNPFKEIVEDLYEKKKNARTPLERWFYKSMLNSSIGKMAQHRNGQEIVIDSVEEAQDYLKKNYEIIKAHKLNYWYKTEKKEVKTKKYYMPIITSLVNANARVFLYNKLKSIPLKDLVYCDTDSVMFQGNHLSKFKISDDIGCFKVEKFNGKDLLNVDMIIYGRKTYSVDKKIVIAGFNQRDMDINDFKEGIVKSKSMVTIKSTNDLKKVGKFIESKRDLNETRENTLIGLKLLEEQKLMVDYDINDISFFINKIKE